MANYYLDANGKVIKEEKKKKKKGTNYILGSDGKVTGVEETENSEGNKWFQAGAMSDGATLKNFGKTVFGTVADAVEDVFTGVIGSGEKILDGMLTAAPYIAQGQYYQNGGAYQPISQQQAFDSYIQAGKEGNAAIVAKDLYDEKAIAENIISKPIEEKTGLNIEQASVLGEKLDAGAQSLGGNLATGLLQMGGVPWFLTTGTSVIGGETESALNNGATIDEAAASGVISAAGEILGEHLTGGFFGEIGLDDAILDKFSATVSSKFANKLFELGVKGTGEGFEEVFSEAMGKLGQKLTYEDEKTWKEMFASEEALDDYLTAFILGDLMGSGNIILRGGKDVSKADTVQTQEAGKVLEAPIAPEIAPENVTEDKLVDIGPAGSEVQNEQNLAKQESMAPIDPTLPAAKKTQAFKTDLTKYDAKQQAVVKKAMESGILNNTEETHKFVDMIAKISADKGISFDFINNQKLKESGLALEGRTVNGFIKGTAVSLNVDSHKALNAVVGHEIMHVLEGTEMYAPLQTLAFKYAQTKGEYDTRLKQVSELYRDLDADINAELAADLVGDYLFTDSDFISRLSTDNPNIFKKIYDEIKYLCRVATAGSKEARDLEKLKRAFEKAYKGTIDSTVKADTNGAIRYNLSKNAASELHKALYDKKYDNEVLLRDDTPAIMLGQSGVKNLPMAMNASHIRENVFSEDEAIKLGLRVDDHIHYHGLGEEFFLKIIDGLDDVELAYRGTKNAADPARREDYFLLVSKFKDAAGNTVNVPVFVNKHAKYNRVFIPTNKVATVFGRQEFYDYIRRQVREKNLVRIKNRSNNSSESPALIAGHYRETTSTDSIPHLSENATKKSLSSNFEEVAPIGSNVYGKDIRLEQDAAEDIGPLPEGNETLSSANGTFSDEIGPLPEKVAPVQQDIDYAPIRENLMGKPVETVKERNAAKLQGYKLELQNNESMRKEAHRSYNEKIAELQASYDAKQNKTTKAANEILQSIERLKRLRDSTDATYEKRISDLKKKVEKMSSREFKIAEQRQTKQEEYRTSLGELMGDTATWKDKALGISYKVNTLRRNLRDIVRKADGSRDIERADALYDELQGTYNRNEASLNREANAIKEKFEKLKINAAEDKYIQMLGEYRDNPDTKILADEMTQFYEAHKNQIDTEKVDKIIESARKLYDELFYRVNEVLREQGMKEIEYRKGYFPHFTEDVQPWWAKLLNWKVKSNEIPTDIAGLTEQFNPDRSWQSFNKHRTSDKTSYSFTKGLDMYVNGALDWIYHIPDIQKRRAFENEIRYRHSEQGLKDRVDAIRNNEEYSAEEMQEQLDIIYDEARNPLNNFVTDFRTQTNTLAGKKSSMDRGMEEYTNRKFYSIMTNASNRVTANMVAGSVSSALTNFIPITQSWGEVSPVSSLRAMGDTIRSTFRDDGTVDKSDFLTNRLRKNQNLSKTFWDKASEKAGLLMEAVDSFTSQTVWRSRYLENLSSGMSENEAIKNADQFAESVMAGRSRGNSPTIFDAKNPLIKVFTAFQLEVSNQYGYMLKDMPQDIGSKSKAQLIKGYATMFLGAYAYNALYSSLTGRDAAFDPIGIIEELLRDLGWVGDDEEEEPTEIITNLVDNVLEEVPYIGGLLGGGRIPISSALPYGEGLYEMFTRTMEDLAEGDKAGLTKEWLNPVYYLALPFGGGQIKKTAQGLSMFSDEHPIAGSYTDSGNLRFPVEDTISNKIKAGIFGQWANKNAQDYLENGRKPLGAAQVEEFAELDLPIADYWKYREGLAGLNTLEEKFDYIAGLDVTTEQKNIMVNNIVDRKEPVDMSNYDEFEDYEEFDFYVKNTEKYEFLKDKGVSYSQYKASESSKKKYDGAYELYKNNPDKYAFLEDEGISYESYAATDETREAYNWAYNNQEAYQLSQIIEEDVVKYRRMISAINNISADKDSKGKAISGSAKRKKIEYINKLKLDYGQKIILYRTVFGTDDTYNKDIVKYLNNRKDLKYAQKKELLSELGITVNSDGSVEW